MKEGKRRKTQRNGERFGRGNRSEREERKRETSVHEEINTDTENILGKQKPGARKH